MRATARVELELASEEEAQTALAALAPDNGGHLRCRLDSKRLILEADAESVMGILRTIDDALACLRATGLG